MLFYLKKYWPIVTIGVIIFCAFYFIQTKDSLLDLEDEFIEFEALEFYEHKDDIEAEIREEKLFVDIKGEVRRPGVYEVEPNVRVIDVISLAGGFTENSAEKYINLAERVYDEMVIYVPSVNDLTELESQPNSYMKTFIESSSNSALSEVNGVRVNQATADELTQLNGIGPQKAQAIIDYREEHGPFKQVEDLLNVNGIGEKTLENMREQIIIP